MAREHENYETEKTEKQSIQEMNKLDEQITSSLNEGFMANPFGKRDAQTGLHEEENALRKNKKLRHSYQQNLAIMLSENKTPPKSIVLKQYELSIDEA
jgi:hypothetical protein